MNRGMETGEDSGGITALRVFVRGLRIEAEIGLNPHERGRSQPLVIDAMATLDPAAPRHLRDTFNYELVQAAAQAVAEGGHVELAETFALRIAERLLAYPGVREATVSVGKPEALHAADLAGAELTLRR
jgi:7,8-dihydroneopterin aldolase/epimerase/oxygenase